MVCSRVCVFQVILVSATMPDEVLEVTTRFMRSPVRILVKKEELTLAGIRQYYIQVDKEVCIYFICNPMQCIFNLFEAMGLIL